jgi:hypothetical protein
MGQEVTCKAKFDGHESQGIAMLETDFVLFRGDFRVKIAFAAMKSVKAAGDWLSIESAEASLKLQLGARAKKWEQKILNPPTLLDKLGVKSGLRVRVVGIPDFAEQLAHSGAIVVEKNPDLIFFQADRKSGLARLSRFSMQPDGALWIVYPKGIREITENDVIAAIRGAGLKDVKVASFSATHSALKAVIPVSQRAPLRPDQRPAR